MDHPTYYRPTDRLVVCPVCEGAKKWHYGSGAICRSDVCGYEHTICMVCTDGYVTKDFGNAERL